MTSTRVDRSALPAVAVLHDVGSASPLTVRAAARDLCRLVFLHDGAQAPNLDQLQLLASGSEVIDIEGMQEKQVALALSSRGVAGVVTFSEYRIRQTASIAAMLNLPGMPPAVAETLTDKELQRRALSAAGVDATRYRAVGRDISSVVASAGFPAVLKPRSGAGSAFTFRIDSEEQLSAVLEMVPPDVGLIAEELLLGDPGYAQRGIGDYVSVESVHTAGRSTQVCITGKLPLEDPFREAGMFLPHALDDETAALVLELERKATSALKVRHGVTHTEVKLTVDGPRLIEVNGRLGGYVPEILRRATGVNLVRTSLEISMGRIPEIPPLAFEGVTYQVFLPVPAGSRGTFRRANGMDEIAGLPGVLQAELTVEPGTRVDWTRGTQSNVGSVYGSAEDLAGFTQSASAIRAALDVEIEQGSHVG